jgi:Trm5-related predicted tRNA methylase
MIVNFRTRKISRDTRKLIQIPILIKTKYCLDHRKNKEPRFFFFLIHHRKWKRHNPKNKNKIKTEFLTTSFSLYNSLSLEEFHLLNLDKENQDHNSSKTP